MKKTSEHRPTSFALACSDKCFIHLRSCYGLQAQTNLDLDLGISCLIMSNHKVYFDQLEKLPTVKQYAVYGEFIQFIQEMKLRKLMKLGHCGRSLNMLVAFSPSIAMFNALGKVALCLRSTNFTHRYRKKRR